MTKLVVQPGMYKTAADTPEPTFEQQFGILSNAIIIDKFPNMADNRVAFQLIQKNDQNTKALGVSVNKLDQQFIQVPSFFIKGKIKTGDMMYIPSIQMFRPMSDAWLADTRDMKLADSGTAVPAQSVGSGTQDPGSIRVKQSNDPIVKTASAAAMVASQTPSVNILSTCLKMGKTASITLLNKLTSDRRMLNGMVKFYGTDNVQNFAKTAALLFQQMQDTPDYQVITPIDKRATQLTDDQRQALFRDGFFIRKTAEYSQRYQAEPATNVLNAKKIEQTSQQFQIPTQNCKCNLLDTNGELHQTYILRPQPVLTDNYIKDKTNTQITHDSQAARQYNTILGSSDYPARFIGVKPGDANYATLPKDIVAHKSSIKPGKEEQLNIGRPLSSTQSVLPYNSVIVTPGGKSYIIYRTLDKVQGKNMWYNGHKTTIAIAEDDRLKKAIISANSMLLPKGSRVVMPQGYTQSGSQSQDKQGRKLNRSGVVFCTLSNYKNTIQRYKQKKYNKVKVYTDGAQYVVSDNQTESKPMQPKEAALQLVQKYKVTPKQAKLMLSDTMMGARFDKPNSNIYYIEKTAADYSLTDQNWQQGSVGSTKMSNSGPTVDSINIDQFKQDPQQLMDSIQKATDQGIKQVFDVTTLKLLAQSSDVSQHIGDYVSDFMACLDKLCRMLFMLYWHGDVMQQKYGMLKLKSLQESIKNSMDSLSQLTVFLKLRGFGGTNTQNYVSKGSLIGGQML